MQYALLIYEHPEDHDLRNDPEKAPAYWAGWSAYSQAVREAGIMRGGEGLQSPQSATTLRLRQGARRVEDGPFSAAKEQLAGFFVIETPDLEAALDWAARCPAAPKGVIEVRPTLGPPPAG